MKLGHIIYKIYNLHRCAARYNEKRVILNREMADDSTRNGGFYNNIARTGDYPQHSVAHDNQQIDAQQTSDGESVG